MYATCLCARFQADPRDLHLIVVKRILRYLKGTPNLGIWYPKDYGLILLDIQILIMQVVLWIEKVPLEVVNS